MADKFRKALCSINVHSFDIEDFYAYRINVKLLSFSQKRVLRYIKKELHGLFSFYENKIEIRFIEIHQSKRCKNCSLRIHKTPRLQKEYDESYNIIRSAIKVGDTIALAYTTPSRSLAHEKPKKKRK